ncbi:hypothetical protein BU17DRAFT_72655 [Hysterangium stoloniferum]|nr:hypothetical protein BU17DRAFT_72655 [Hysterangium stoloniferum]
MFFPGGNGNMYQMRTKAGGVVPIVLTNASLGVRAPTSIPPRPLHDPMQDHAIVLYDPTIDERETDEEGKERVKEEERVNAIKEAQEKNKGLFNPHKNLRSLFGERQQKNQKQSKVPVVIDPRLSKVLRPHQVEGVKVIIIVISNEAERSSSLVFVPLHNWNARGQPIWLYYGRRDRSRQNSTVYCALVDSSQIITTPCLVRNWANEFSESINPTAAITHTVPSLALDGKGTKAEMIERVQGWAMLIVSYETLRTLQPYLVNVEVGLLLCDEGHCLKNGGTRNDFRKNFENAIIRRRDADATDKDKQKWQEKLQEMSGLVTKFRIQRTNDLFEQTSPYPVVARGLVLEEGLIVNGAAKFVVLERYGYVRLDGGMAITKRQKYVDQFNDPERSEFVFLLSSKAGGCGINLIGANRLILFDPDWNPAADQQALARVWRDGQKKEYGKQIIKAPALLYGDASTIYGGMKRKKAGCFRASGGWQDGRIKRARAIWAEAPGRARDPANRRRRRLQTHRSLALLVHKKKRPLPGCGHGLGGAMDGPQATLSSEFRGSPSLFTVIRLSVLLPRAWGSQPQRQVVVTEQESLGTWNHFTNSELKNNHDDLLRAEAGLREISVNRFKNAYSGRTRLQYSFNCVLRSRRVSVTTEKEKEKKEKGTNIVKHASWASSASGKWEDQHSQILNVGFNLKIRIWELHVAHAKLGIVFP